jgi:hypothetical protein
VLTQQENTEPSSNRFQNVPDWWLHEPFGPWVDHMFCRVGMQTEIEFHE